MIEYFALFVCSVCVQNDDWFAYPQVRTAAQVSEFKIFAQTYFGPGVLKSEVIRYIGKPNYSDGKEVDWYRFSDEEAVNMNRAGKEIYLRIYYTNDVVIRVENAELNVFRVIQKR
jgi:hypothetical protein